MLLLQGEDPGTLLHRETTCRCCVGVDRRRAGRVGTGFERVEDVGSRPPLLNAKCSKVDPAGLEHRKDPA